MCNNNGNGVTVKLREKAEKILLSKYDRAVAKVKKEHRELIEKLEKKVISEWGLDKLVTELVKLMEKAKALEEEISAKLGYSYGYSAWEDWNRGNFQGKKLEEEVKARAEFKIDLGHEEQRLQELKDELLEELWLAGQSDDVRKILSQMT